MENKVSGFSVPKIERRKKFECKNYCHIKTLFNAVKEGILMVTLALISKHKIIHAIKNRNPIV
ncbi:hypothetical protein [Tissierella praeacuta]|uniref:hypothetical protein n=1 Tax=Tissierella praeacuta TaxID=43131 RepID=UPI000932FFB3|nr:hypothetical protein [Tissierella praeacuta]